MVESTDFHTRLPESRASEITDVHAPREGREWRIYEIKFTCVVESDDDEQLIEETMKTLAVQWIVKMEGHQPATFMDGHPTKRNRLSDEAVGGVE